MDASSKAKDFEKRPREGEMVVCGDERRASEYLQIRTNGLLAFEENKVEIELNARIREQLQGISASGKRSDTWLVEEIF